tara:strand:- start:116 stop:502 length:387 start_codon:yes stop_codon:yes gene_type:complete
MNNRRRNFRSRPQKNNFRRRTSSLNGSNGSNFGSNGNLNFNRNGSMSNPHFVEKTMQKFQQLAKDAQSSGDLVLVENYLQHADHYSRRLAELSVKIKVSSDNLVETKNNSTSKENSEVSANQKQVITK